MVKPTLTLEIGSLLTSTDNPVAGIKNLVIERDMDIPADVLRLQLMERSGIALDNAVSAKLGYDGNEEVVFTGNVVALKPAIAAVEIQALGHMNVLLNLRTSATFENQSAGDIAHHLINEAGATAGTVENGVTFPRYYVDNRISAYEHLRSLADRLGYELYTDRNGNIMFHPLGPAAGLDSLGGLGSAVAGALGGAGLSFVYKQHLLQAAADRQPVAWRKIDVGGESPMSGKGDTTSHWLTINDSDYRGEAGDGSPQILVRDPAARTKDLADRFAAGLLATHKRNAHEISITVLGQAQIDLGDSISSSDVPDDLIDGSGYVRAIRHRFGEGIGFVTDVRISLDVNE
ncbi:hypothetical protein EH223_19305 [candidate division KSB1 bacterium]|nr:hypothetical protein [candidate division KSB1 bacterium]RQW00097.1 MAG: hypothetical protein EH223_19305 [candidate division KSB1 bacterium]